MARVNFSILHCALVLRKNSNKAMKLGLPSKSFMKNKSMIAKGSHGYVKFNICPKSDFKTKLPRGLRKAHARTGLPKKGTM